MSTYFPCLGHMRRFLVLNHTQEDFECKTGSLELDRNKQREEAVWWGRLWWERLW